MRYVHKVNKKSIILKGVIIGLTVVAVIGGYKVYKQYTYKDKYEVAINIDNIKEKDIVKSSDENEVFKVFEVAIHSISDENKGFSYVCNNDELVSDINKKLASGYKIGYSNGTGLYVTNIKDEFGNIYMVDVAEHVYDSYDLSNITNGEVRVISAGADGDLNTGSDNHILSVEYNKGKIKSKVYKGNEENSRVVVDCGNKLSADDAAALGFVFDYDTGTIVNYTGTATDIVIPSIIGDIAVKSIGYMAFYNSTLKNISISQGIEQIYDYAFSCSAYNNVGLRSVQLPNTIKYIGKYAFKGNQLGEVLIPDSINTLEEGVFAENRLCSVVMSDSVTKIGEYAFINNSIVNIDIPSSVISIGNKVFENNNIKFINYIGNAKGYPWGANMQ